MTNEERAEKLAHDIEVFSHRVEYLDSDSKTIQNMLENFADEVRRECAAKLNGCKSLTVHVMDGKEDDWYSYKSIRLGDAIAAIMGNEACKTCGLQCPDDCPMDED